MTTSGTNFWKESFRQRNNGQFFPFPYPSWKHLVFTKYLHLIELSAVIFVRLHRSRSRSIECLQVFLGQLLVRVPWEFHSSTILIIPTKIVLIVWPIHYYFLSLIHVIMGFSLAIFQRSMLLRLHGQNMLLMILWHLLMNA